MASTVSTPLPELETASPEVKRYQRQKITIVFVSTILSLSWLAILGIMFGPELGRLFTSWFGAEGSPAVFRARWSDEKTLNGAWERPGGAYELTMTRVADGGRR